jgi:glutamate formiminotransferase
VPGRGPSAECVINISEGRDRSAIASIAGAGGDWLLDLHSDADHHRSVLTLGGPLDEVEAAARAVAETAVAIIDLPSHAGVHPRLGAIDVVPFVPLDPVTSGGDGWRRAHAARDRFAAWAGSVLGLPCFLYGPERSLPDVRRYAFGTLVPDTGPPTPHPTAGACAVGVRPILVAYNLWITDEHEREPSAVVTAARALAASVRSGSVRSLGLPVQAGAQVSCNLVDLTATSIVDLYDAVAAGAAAQGCSVARAELVGLLPETALRAAPRTRWGQLDLAEDRTIEHRMALRGHPVNDH